MTKALKLTKWDILLMALLFVLGVSLLVFTVQGAPGNTVQVLEDDRVIFEHTLSAETAFEKELTLSNGHVVTVAAENGRVYMAGAECPDHTCVKTGAIHRSGQVIVCLPNHVVIKISGGEGELDGKTY